MLEGSRQRAEGSAAAPALRAERVGHQFHPSWWVLREVSLEVCPGELTGIVGPNGAGKSTLLRVLAGHLTPRCGAVTLEGRPLGAWPRLALARRIGYLPQEVPALFDYTCEQVVAQGRYPHMGVLGLARPRDREAIHRALQWTHTDAFARRPLGQLSGGERRRVLLASVLAQETPILLLDEPTAALDIHHQIDVMTRLAALARQGPAVALVTHDLNLAAQFCDRLIVLHEGRLAADGPPREVLTEPLLRRVYETDLRVIADPEGGGPIIMPVLKRAAAGAVGLGSGA